MFRDIALIVFIVITVGVAIVYRDIPFTDAKREAAADTPLQFEHMGGLEGSVGTSTKEARDAFRARVAPYGVNGIIPKTVFDDAYDTLGPNTMITVLSEGRLCHNQAHNLGRSIYEHTHDMKTAVETCRSSCSGGCIHGVLMSYFDERSAKTGKDFSGGQHVELEDLTPELKRDFASTCAGRTVTQFTGTGNCYHAVGHAFATIADYDIPASIGLCDIFKKSGPGAVYYCATGVYMERSIMFGESDDQTPGDSLYPCSTGPYPAACYRYKIYRLYPLKQNIDGAIDACEAREGSDREGCFHGIGFGASQMIYNDPSLISRYCDAGTAMDRRMCLEGAFGFTNVFDRSVAKRACATYKGDRALCDAAKNHLNFDMRIDFAPYVGQST